jgi:uncharacterized membrane protein YphA (DoxX/SURF4 family)
MNIGLLILRLTVGLTLAAHGTQKLFGSVGLGLTPPVSSSKCFGSSRVGATP